MHHASSQPVKKDKRLADCFSAQDFVFVCVPKEQKKEQKKN